MSERLSPADIKFLLHVYSIAEPYAGIMSNWLFNEGLVEASPQTESGHRLTEGGEMLVAALLSVPIPVRVTKWSMP